MISPLAMPSRSRNLWGDVDHILLSALRHASTARELATTSGLPQDLVSAQLDVYVRDGLAARIGLGGLHYQLTLTGWQRLFQLAESNTSPGHPAAA